MRTTLTLDDDVAVRLTELAHRKRTSFKETVNTVLRRGLAAQQLPAKSREAFHTATFQSAFRAGVDPAKLNQLVDELEAHKLARP